jgi:hypothetical protein
LRTRSPAAAACRCAPGAAPDRPEQWAFRILADAGAIQTRVQVRVKRVMARHLVTLAALFAQPHPQPPVLRVDVVDAHRERGADPAQTKTPSGRSAPGRAGRPVC